MLCGDSATFHWQWNERSANNWISWKHNWVSVRQWRGRKFTLRNYLNLNGNENEVSLNTRKASSIWMYVIGIICFFRCVLFHRIVVKWHMNRVCSHVQHRLHDVGYATRLLKIQLSKSIGKFENRILYGAKRGKIKQIHTWPDKQSENGKLSNSFFS